MKRTIKQTKKRGLKKGPAYAMVFLMGACLVVTVVSSISASSKAAQILDVEKRTKILADENRELKMKTINGTALSVIAEKAEELEMVAPGEIVYVGTLKEASLARAE